MNGRGSLGARSRRLFFALWPDEALRARLGRMARWCRHRSGGREVPDENLHLTLLFLGDVAPHQVALAQRAGGAVALGRCAFTLDRVEFLPRARVLAATPGERATGLEAAVRTLRADLGARLPLSREAFSPHVTLVRRVEALADVPMEPLEWQVESFALVESLRPDGAGPVYVPLEVWPAR